MRNCTGTLTLPGKPFAVNGTNVNELRIPFDPRDLVRNNPAFASHRGIGKAHWKRWAFSLTDINAKLIPLHTELIPRCVRASQRLTIPDTAIPRKQGTGLELSVSALTNC